MHLPGLLYLAALGNFAHQNVGTSHGLLLIVVFNIVMLAPIELPLLCYIVAPRRTEEAVRSVNSFINEHRWKGLLLLSVVAGGYLIVSGIVGLWTESATSAWDAGASRFGPGRAAAWAGLAPGRPGCHESRPGSTCGWR